MAEKQPAPDISFFEKHSVVIRVWHWLTYFLTTAALTSVFVATQILNPKENVNFIREKLGTSGNKVTAEGAMNAARGITDKVWDWHVYIGYVLAGLLAIRLIAELFLPREEKFFRKMRNGSVALKSGEDKKHATHYFLVKLSYLGFYLVFITTCLTGLGMAFKQELELSKAFVHNIREIHNICMYIILAFVGAHIAGVVYQEFNKNKGLVSEMIGGYQKNNERE